MPNFVRISRTENVRNREQFDKLIKNKNDYVYGTSRSTLAMAVYKARFYLHKWALLRMVFAHHEHKHSGQHRLSPPG